MSTITHWRWRPFHQRLCQARTPTRRQQDEDPLLERIASTATSEMDVQNPAERARKTRTRPDGGRTLFEAVLDITALGRRKWGPATWHHIKGLWKDAQRFRFLAGRIAHVAQSGSDRTDCGSSHEEWQVVATPASLFAKCGRGLWHDHGAPRICTTTLIDHGGAPHAPGETPLRTRPHRFADFLLRTSPLTRRRCSTSIAAGPGSRVYVPPLYARFGLYSGSGISICFVSQTRADSS